MKVNQVFYNSLDSQLTDGHFDQSKMNWPKKGMQLLKKPTKKTSLNARVAAHWMLLWRGEFTLAGSYKDGADQLVEAVLKGGDGGHPDRFVFPILYLYRHAAEIHLKLLVRHGLELHMIPSTEKAEEALCGHALYPLWNLAMLALKKMWPDGDASQLLAVEGMISQLHRADPSGQHLRYAHLADGSLAKLDLPDWIDLENLRKVFDCLWSFLGGSYDGLDDALSHQREAEKEFRQNMEQEFASEMGGEEC